MKYKLKVYSIQEFGQRKDSLGNPHQEDSMFPEFGKQSDSDRLFILCDGMGGHDAGEVASAAVCEAMSRSILGDGHDREGVFSEADFKAALDAAFRSLDARDSGAAKKMGTTMTFLKLHAGGAFIAHIGDSRVYHIRPGKDGEQTRILFETEDHSLVNDLIKVGELTREEARHSRQKNVITRAMQPDMNPRPKADIYQTADIKPGDYFYMCSDGMLEQTEMEDGTSIRNIFSAMGGDDKNKVEILKSVTEDNRDNHTAFIIHITDVEGPAENIAPTATKADKFTAIVEDAPVAVAPTGVRPSAPSQRVKTDRKPEKKGLLPLIIGIVIAALIAGGIFLFIGDLKSCSSEKTTEQAETPKIYRSVGKPIRKDAQATKTTTAEAARNEPKAGESATNDTAENAATAETAAEAAAAVTKNVKQQSREDSSKKQIQKLTDKDEVVNSDEDKLRDSLNHLNK